MKKLIWGFLLLLTACSGRKNNYDATGTFEATEIMISGETPGMIIEFPVMEGSRVTKGEVMAVIDSTQLYLQKQQLLQNIIAIQANRPEISTQIAPLQEQLTKQYQEKARITNLLKADAGTQKQLDDINSAIFVLEKQIAAQENALGNSRTSTNAQVLSLRSQIAQVDDRLKKCRLVAPIDGIVIAKYAQAGELTAAGSPMLKVADMDHIHLKAYVTAAQLMDIKLGQQVEVRADFGKGNYREYRGEICWISDKSEFTPKNITTSDDRANMVYAIKVSVPNDGYLKLGLYGEIKFR